MWSDWFSGACSRTCGGGTLSKTRIKIQIEVGTKCDGEATSQTECNIEDCPGKYF